MKPFQIDYRFINSFLMNFWGGLMISQNVRALLTTYHDINLFLDSVSSSAVALQWTSKLQKWFVFQQRLLEGYDLRKQPFLVSLGLIQSKLWLSNREVVNWTFKKGILYEISLCLGSPSHFPYPHTYSTMPYIITMLLLKQLNA